MTKLKLEWESDTILHKGCALRSNIIPIRQDPWCRCMHFWCYENTVHTSSLGQSVSDSTR
jgi:hypothetical protein